MKQYSMATFPALVCLQVLCCLVCAEIKTIGNIISPGLNFPADGPSTWIDLTTELPPSVVIRWRLFSRLPAKPVQLQIWRPVSDNRYLLVAEHRAVPTSIGLHEYDLPPYERVHVQQGDLIGFSNEQDQGPIAYSHTPQVPGNALKMFYNTTAGAPRVGHVFRFGSYRYSRMYSFNVDIVHCSPRWSVIDLYCAKVMEEKITWDGARDLCQRSGGHLATPKSLAYVNALRNQMILITVPSLWIGIEFNETSEQFTWTDDNHSNVYGAPWAPGEPQRPHRCVALSIDGQWTTRDCYSSASYVCQEKHNTKTTNDTSLYFQNTGAREVMCNETKMDDLDTTGISNIICVTPGYKFNKAVEEELEVLKNIPKTQPNMSTLVQVTTALSTLATNNVFKAKLEDLDINDAKVYLKSIADVASSVLDGETCNCDETWKTTPQVGKPIETALLLEDIAQDVTSYLTGSNVTADLVTETPAMRMRVNVLDEVRDVYDITTASEDIRVSLNNAFFLPDAKKIGISTIEYKSMHELMDYEDLSDMNGFHKFSSRVWLNSRVLAVSVFPAVTNSSPEGSAINFVFSNLQAINETIDEPTCVFWDPDWKTWSSLGCHVTFWNENETRCECSHLTNFAVLVQTFDVPLSRQHRHALTLLTYIGCGLSIIGCICTIIVLLIGRCTSERGLILINLCSALCVAHVVFFFGIEYPLHTKGCVAVAILLHYFYLSAFFWMLAQGIELYLKLKVVFTTRSRTPHYLLLGWGFPAIIVTVSVAMRIEDYGKDEFCWLSFRTGLIWSFIGPVIIIAMGNFFVLCMALSTFREHRPGKEGGPVLHAETGRSRSRSAARAAIILLPVLGVTWLTGLLSVNKYTIIFQYIFAACNSLQGCLIFIFHCVLNDELRSSCHRHFCRSRSESNSSTDGRSVGGATRYPGSQPTVVEQMEKQPASATPSVESGIDSSTSWDVPHRISLASLLPGRSKRIPITDPKTLRHCAHPKMDF